MRKMLLAMACAAVAAFSAPLSADDREDCSSNDVERMIRGCTEVINGRQDLRQTLAIAHHRRGTAYASKKDYDRAIADFTMAIEIDPTHVAAYNDRGLAYTSKGDYVRAIADVTRAVELTAPPPKTIGATPPSAGKTAKTEPKSTKTSATVDKSSAPAAAKSTTIATPPPSPKKAKSAPADSAKTSTIAKGSAPAPAKTVPKATPGPGETGSDSPNWANQILNNREMN
jgi:hypothetical protein